MFFSGIVQHYRCAQCEKDYHNELTTSIVPMGVVVIWATVIWSRTFQNLVGYRIVGAALGLLISIATLWALFELVEQVSARHIRKEKCPRCGGKLQFKGNGFFDGMIPSPWEIAVYILTITIAYGAAAYVPKGPSPKTKAILTHQPLAWASTTSATNVELSKTITIARKSMNTEPWPFDQPKNCVTFTTRPVMSGAEPITYVSHDEDDHGWQFIGPSGASSKEAMVAGLGEIVKLDASALEVADLPPGWIAERTHPGASWTRSKHPGYPESEM